LGGGIDYGGGFLPLAGVTVYRDYGLVFDAASGILFQDYNGNGIQDPGEAAPYAPAGSYSVSGDTLTLNDFSWVTSAQYALTIINGPATLELNGTHTFSSTNATGAGIKSNGDLTTTGDGTLTARGSGVDGYGIDIGNNDLSISSGTLIAQGGKQAVLYNPGAGNSAGPSGIYYYWLWSQYYDGAGDLGEKGDSVIPGNKWNDGYAMDEHFQYFRSDRYVMLQSLKIIHLVSAVQVGGESHMADSTGIMLTLSGPAAGLTAEDIIIDPKATGVVKGTKVSGVGTTWLIPLDDISAEGTVDIVVAYFGDYFLIDNEIAHVEVYKADAIYTLTANAAPPEGGALSLEGEGRYMAGTPIEVEAEAADGYDFTGWTVTGAAIIGGNNANPATFEMPSGDVTLTANFTAKPPPPVYNMTVNAATGGTTSETGTASLHAGDLVRVTATASANYAFSHWVVTGGGGAFENGSATNPAVFIMPANDVALTPFFVPIDTTYTLAIVPPVNGRVSGTAPGSYNENAVIQVRAAADSGYVFTGWTVADSSGKLPAASTENPYAFSMPASGVTLTANFSVAPPNPAAYYLTVNTAAGGTASGTGITARRAGDPISVTATASANYIFRYWIVTDSSGTFVDGSTANPAVFDMPANNVTLTPYFVP